MERQLLSVSTNCDPSKIFVVDPVEHRVAVINYESFANKELIRHFGDNTVGTVAYINTEFNFYGVIQPFNGKLELRWISIENFNNDTKHNKVLLDKDLLVDVTQCGERVLNKYWFRDIPGVVVKSLSRWMEKKDRLFGVGEATKEPQETVEEPQETVEEPQKTAEEKIETPIDNIGVRNYIKELSLREAAVQAKEIEVQNKLTELTEKSNRLSTILDTLSKKNFDSAVEVILDVDEVTKIGMVNTVKTVSNEFAYEMLLKAAMDNDSITVSKEYLSKLKIYMKKSLEANLGYTKYRAIVQIKFESTSENSILAIIDYDEDKDTARVTILKAFCNERITTDEVSKYYIAYEQWRRGTFIK